MDMSKWEPEQISIKNIRRESEARVNASITRLGVSRDSGGIDPYDNTPSFAKNKEARFRSQQTGYTNSLLEKILESQTNKDAWAATQQYQKKSLEHLEKISSKLTQLVPDKKEEQKEFEKTKARISGVTRALLSGNGKDIGKMIWQGIKEAETPMSLQMIMDMYPMIQMALEAGGASGVVKMVGDQINDIVMENLPKSMSSMLKHIKEDLPEMIDAQFIQMYNELHKFTNKTGGNRVGRDALQIMKQMGINGELGASVDNLQSKSKNFKDKMLFDRAFYETVTNGIPQQLARIEQAIRGGYVFHWDAKTGKFKRMDSHAFKDIVNPNNLRTKMSKASASNFIEEIADNADISRLAGNAGIRIKRNKNGEKEIDSEVVTAVLGFKWHDLLSRDNAVATILSLNRNTKPEDIRRMVSSVVDVRSWSQGSGYSPFAEYDRAEVDEADRIVGGYILRVLMAACKNQQLRDIIIEQAKNVQQELNDYADQLSYHDGFSIDLEATVQSGAINMAGALGNRGGNKGGKKSKPKFSASKDTMSLYGHKDRDENTAKNKIYSITQLTKAITSLTVDESEYDFADGASDKVAATYAIKKKLVTLQKNDVEWRRFVNSCINQTTGNIDDKKFQTAIKNLITKDNAKELETLRHRMLKSSGGKKRYGNGTTTKDKNKLNEDIADSFKNSVNRQIGSIGEINDLATTGSNLIGSLLEEEQMSLKKMGLNVAIVTKFTKEALSERGIITNPLMGTVIGSMLGAGSIFIQHTKYFNTLIGKDPNSQDSDGNLTNQQRVMSDLLTNKVGPLMAGLGLGAGVNKVFKKMGPIGRIIGIPAAIVTGVAAFGATTMGKELFGEALVGEKQKDGSRKGRNKITRIVRDVAKTLPGIKNLLYDMEAEADAAEKHGMSLREYRKSRKNGERLYRDGNSTIKITKDGTFTVSGQVKTGQDKDGNDTFSKKTASGSLITKDLAVLQTQLKVANDNVNKELQNLTPEELQRLDQEGLANVARGLKPTDNIDNLINEIGAKGGGIGKFARAYLIRAKAQKDLEAALNTAATESFNSAIKSSELSSLSVEEQDYLRSQYVTRAIDQYKENTLHDVLFPDEKRSDSAFGKIKQNMGSVLTSAKMSLWTKAANSQFEFLRDIGTDKLQSMDSSENSKALTRRAESLGGGMDDFLNEDGSINQNIFNPTEIVDETEDPDGDKETEDPEKVWREATYDAQYDMATSLRAISSQIGRLFYESLPVYEREPSLDDVMNRTMDNADDSELGKFKKIAGSHIGYKAGANGKNKFTKDGRAYCTTGSRQATIQAVGKESAERIFNGTANMGDPKKIIKAYEKAGIWRTKKHAPTEGSELFFKNKKGGIHAGIVKSINGDNVIVQEYNDAQGGVSEQTYSLTDLMSKGGTSGYIGHGALNWDKPTEPVSDVAPDLEPGTDAGPGDDTQPIMVAPPSGGIGDYGSQIVQKLSLILESGIPVNVVNDLSALGNVGNNEAFRDMQSSAKRSIASIKSPEVRRLMENALNSYRVLRSKDGVKKENEQEEENEDLQTSAFRKIIENGAGSPSPVSTEAAMGGTEALAGEAAGAAAGSGSLSSILSIIGGAGGGAGLMSAITSVAPVVGGIAATVLGVGGAIAGLIGLYKLADKYGIIEFIGKAKDKVMNLMPWNWFKDNSEGSEINDDGSVKEYGSSNSVNDSLHHVKDAVNLTKGLIGAGKKIITGSMAGAKKLVTSVAHPIDTIKNAISKVKDVGGSTTGIVAKAKQFTGAIAGVLAKACDWLSGSFVTKIPWIGKHIKSVLTKLSAKMGKFSAGILEKLGPLFKKAGQEATKNAGKKGLKSIPFLNLALLGFSFSDGYRNAADYLGMMPANIKDKNDKSIVKPTTKMKVCTGFLRMVWDNLISMAGTYYGTALAAVTLGTGTGVSIGIAIVAGIVEGLWHVAMPFPNFLEKFVPLFADPEELRESRINNKNVAEMQDTPDGVDSAVAAVQEDANEPIDGLDPDEEAGATDEASTDAVAEDVERTKASTVASANATAGTGETAWYNKLGGGIWSVTKSTASSAWESIFGSKYSKNLKSYSGSDHDSAVSALLQNAESQIGYTEYGNNGNMYAKEVGAQNYQPWCSTFQDYLFTKTFGKDRAAALLGGSANQPSTWERAKKLMNIEGGYVKNDGSIDPQPGDLAFFDFKGEKRHSNPTNHIALVTKVDPESGTVETIEGNTQPEKGSGSQSNGGMVAKRLRYYKGDKSSIVSFGRPDWSKISSANVATNSADGKLKPGEQAGGIMEALGSLERGINTVHRGTRTIANAKRSAEAIKRTIDYTKEANKGKSFWEKARNNTRAASSIIGNVGRVAGDIGHTLPGTKIGEFAMNTAGALNVADRVMDTTSRQFGMVGNVIANVQTKTAGGIIDAVQTSGHILSSGFGGLIQGMDVNTRKLDQVCNTGDRTIRVLEEIKDILGKNGLLATNAGVASIS